MIEIDEAGKQEERAIIEGPDISNPSNLPEVQKPRRKSRALWALVGIVILAWILIRPGVFTIQPIGVLPEGITFIYYGRGAEMPFFSSPDGLCLQMQGSVSLFCRGAALSAATELKDRILLRLPYNHWAYLRSTDGLEFDR